MNRIAVVAFVAASCPALLSCGKELCRVPFAAEGAATATATLAQGQVAFWTDLDLDYEGDASLLYQIQLVQAGTTVATATCNPLGELPVRSSWVETNIGSKHSRRGDAKMECSTKLRAGGPTTVKVSLAFARKPISAELRKADLVLKQ
jgi:hypothetical protein